MFIRQLSVIALAFFLLASSVQAQYGAKDGEWRSYGGDPGASKYAPLSIINKDNVKKLEIAWRWSSPDNDIRNKNVLNLLGLLPFIHEPTPLMINGVLYTSTSFSQAAAIDAATGKTKWVHDPETWKAGRPTNLGFVHRGLAYWTDGKEERVFLGTGDAFLLALDATTGKPCQDFGDKGRIDLTQGLHRKVDRKQYAVTSPPLICRDVVMVGSSINDFPRSREMPPGDVRGFDPRTGKLLWTFHTVPRKDQPGVETWEEESWKYTGNTNVWAPMSADDELGYVYLPVSTPTNDWYGGHRKGNNLYADSIVCLEAKTGKRIWHFQIVHHGLWDYDVPAAPTLCDIMVAGKKIKAVAQLTKQGMCFVFDRQTGKPVWPIEERDVPQSTVPGESSSKTQPFPTKPPPYERQGVKEEELIDFTPELRKEALAIIQKFDHGPLYTPPSLKGAINLPGWAGGSNWQGGAFDPETGMLYVPSITAPIVVRLEKTKGKSEFHYERSMDARLEGPQGLPLFKPPYGRVTAIDLNKGEHAWMVPLGRGPRDHPALQGVKDLPEKMGGPQRGHALATRTVLFVGQEGSVEKIIGLIRDGKPVEAAKEQGGGGFLYAFDKKTGATLAEIKLPNPVTGALMTYVIGKKQYLVFPVGGLFTPDELIALSLPDSK
jgi:quinoprotein glucose dehydrogenase